MTTRNTNHQESFITCRDCNKEWDCSECLRIFDTFDDLVYNMQMTQQITKPKMVWLLSHWDQGEIGIFNTCNDAKKDIRYKKLENYRGFFKTPWGWMYHGGGYEIRQMTEDEAEMWFRWNEQ